MAKKREYTITAPKTSTGYKKYTGKYKRPSKDEFQNLFNQINEDQKTLANQIKKLIQGYHEDLRKTDAERYTLLETKFKQICENIKKGSSSVDLKSLKSKINKEILNNDKLSKEQKTDLSEAIKDLEKTVITDTAEKINSYIKENSDSITKNPKLKKSIFTRYRSILENEVFMSALSNGFSRIFLSRIEADKKYILSNSILRFKRKNKELFPEQRFKSIERMSFTDIIKKNPQSDIFLKYNKLVVNILKSKVGSLNEIDFKKMKQRMLRISVNKDINRVKNKYRKIINTGFHPLMTSKIWVQKFKRKLNNEFNALRMDWKASSAWDKISGVASIVNAIGTFYFKLFKGAFKLGFSILSGIYNIGFKVLSSAISLIKNIVSLSIKIVKTVVITSKNIFNRISIFLLSPMGSYLMGVVVGYLFNKMKQVIPWLVDKAQYINKKLKEKLVSIDKRWSKANVIQDENGEITLQTTFYQDIKDRIKKYTDKIDQYYKLFTDNDEDDWNQFKTQLNEDTGYANIILDIEDRISKQLGVKSTDELIGFWNMIKEPTEEVFNAISKLMDLADTGIAQRATGRIAKTSLINMTMTTLAIATGPLGAILAGVMTPFLEETVNYAYRHMRYNNKDTPKIKQKLFGMEYDEQSNEIPRKISEQKDKLRTLQEELKVLKQKNKSTTETETEIEKVKSRIANMQNAVNSQGRISQIESLLDKVNPNFIASATAEDIINLMYGDRKTNVETKFDKYTKKSPGLARLFGALSDYMKNNIMNYVIDKENGLISQEQLKENIEGIQNSAYKIKTPIRKHGNEEDLSGAGNVMSYGDLVADGVTNDYNNKEYLSFINEQMTGDIHKETVKNSLNNLSNATKLLHKGGSMVNQTYERILNLLPSDERQIANRISILLKTVIQKELTSGNNNEKKLKEVVKDYISMFFNGNSQIFSPSENMFLKTYDEQFIKQGNAFERFILPRNVDTSKIQEVFNSDIIKDEDGRYRKAKDDFMTIQKKFSDCVDVQTEIKDVLKDGIILQAYQEAKEEKEKSTFEDRTSKQSMSTTFQF